MSDEKQEEKGGGLSFLTLLGAGVLYYFFARPRLLTWGTVPGEENRKLPGDDLIEFPNMQATRALDIEARPEAIWPWLSQMGRERTGFYALDWLTNESIPSANYIRHDLPPVEAGMKLDRGLQVLRVEKGKSLIIGAFDLPNLLGTTTDITFSYFLQELHDGKTRLIVRMRGYSYGLAGSLYNLMVEPLDFVQTTAQLNKLRELAISHQTVVVRSQKTGNGKVYQLDV